MVCSIHDPNLASLLAGKEEVMPEPHEAKIVCGLLAVHILFLLALGVFQS